MACYSVFVSYEKIRISRVKGGGGGLLVAPGMSCVHVVPVDAIAFRTRTEIKKKISGGFYPPHLPHLVYTPGPRVLLDLGSNSLVQN